MKILKIKIPKGFELDSFDQASGEIKFKETPKPVQERIKTIDDVLADNGITMGHIEGIFDQAPEHFRHQYIAELICASLNECWTPDWSDGNQCKYFPWFKMEGTFGFHYAAWGSWKYGSGTSSRFCFKSRDLAVYAGEQFTEVYKNFMLIKTNNNKWSK